MSDSYTHDGPRSRWGARAVSCGARRASGLLDGRDVELEADLVGDEHAAGLERGVEGDAPVLAVDRGGALEAGADVAERVLGEAGELEGHGDRLGGVADREVTGDREGVAVLLDRGRAEGDLRVDVHGEE